MRLSIVTASLLAFIGAVKAYEDLPFPCAETYQVTAGESRQSVASKFGFSVEQIDEWNPCDLVDVSKCGNLQPGELLCIDHAYAKAKRVVKSKRWNKAKRGGIIPAKPAMKNAKSPAKPGSKPAMNNAKSPAKLGSKPALKQNQILPKTKPFNGVKSPQKNILPIHQKRAAIPPSVLKLAIEKTKESLCSWISC